MPWTVKTPPASYPVDLETALDHLRLGGDDGGHNARVTAALAATTTIIERDIDGAMVQRTIVAHYDGFPGADDELTLPISPAIAVVAIKYLDADGVEQTLSTDVYRADVVRRPGRVTLQPGQSWPETRRLTGAVTVEYTAGYAQVPDDLVAAVQLLTAHLFENPEATSSLKLNAIPMGVDRILREHRRVRL
ncbi:MAG: hypothetical protein AAGC44_05210 [Planctomycetota bacterium]